MSLMRGLNLHELALQYAHINNALEESEGDITDWPEQMKTMLDAAPGALAAKGEGCARLIQKWEAECEVYRQEEVRLAARRHTRENAIKHLKEWVRGAMELAKLSKLKTELFAFSIQNNPPSVRITNELVIPTEYQKMQVVIDKAEIAKALKAGEEIPGVELVQTQSLRMR
jgi:hypothetical protein